LTVEQNKNKNYISILILMLLLPVQTLRLFLHCFHIVFFPACEALPSSAVAALYKFSQ